MESTSEHPSPTEITTLPPARPSSSWNPTAGQPRLACSGSPPTRTSTRWSADDRPRGTGRGPPSGRLGRTGQWGSRLGVRIFPMLLEGCWHGDRLVGPQGCRHGHRSDEMSCRACADRFFAHVRSAGRRGDRVLRRWGFCRWGFASRGPRSFVYDDIDARWGFCRWGFASSSFAVIGVRCGGAERGGRRRAWA